MSEQFQLSEAARKYALLAVQQQKLWEEGLGSSEEADRIAGAMDVPWHAMSDAERVLMRGLNADLNDLLDQRSPFVHMEGPEKMQFTRKANLAEVQLEENGDPTLWFEVLRGKIPADNPQLQMDQVRFFQGKMWCDLQLPEVAIPFVKASTTYNPVQHSMVCWTFVQAGRGVINDALDYARHIINKYPNNPQSIFCAAYLFYWARDHYARTEFDKDLIGLAPLIGPALQRPLKEDYNYISSPLLSILEFRCLAQIDGMVHEHLRSIGQPTSEFDQDLQNVHWASIRKNASVLNLLHTA